MLTCKEVVRILGSAQKLSFVQRVNLLLHLLICRQCVSYSKHLKILKQGVKKLFREKAEVTPVMVKELEAKVLKTVYKKE